MGKTKMDDSSKSDYEALRNARMSENKARFESLGILNSVSKLREISALIKLKNKRPWVKKDYSLNPRRRSQRIKNVADGTTAADKGRGCVLSSFLGISCHFCRLKKLCGEEDCKRCGNCDVNEPCIGKTDCSVCHSGRGVFCRACLKVRYGEEIEEVRENKEWMCPHCIEEKGINPYWICNSLNCMKKRNMQPNRFAIRKARKMGYESVAHLLMEQLKHGNYPKLDESL